MKKKRIGLIIVMLTAVAILAAVYVPALAQPGDANDPLVTRRYVDGRIDELTAEIASLRSQMGLAPAQGAPATTGTGLTQAERDALFADIMVYFEAVYGDLLRTAGGMPPSAPLGDTLAGVFTDPPPAAIPSIPLPSAPGEVVPFEAIFLHAGQTLIAEAGVEFILRSGDAIAVSGPDGMVNITVGRDVTNGEVVPANNLMLVPRTDGRGLYFLTDSWLMIKGRYQVVSHLQ